MENKNKRISVRTLTKIIDSVKTESQDKQLKYIVDGKETFINVKSIISKDDMNNIIDVVVNGVFIDGEYVPQNFQSIFVRSILAYYTDVKFDIKEDKLGELLYETTIIDNIINIINPVQLTHIKTAIEDGISFKKQSIISNNEIKMKKLTEKMNKDIDEIASQVVVLLAMIEQNFTKDDKNKLIKATEKLSNMNTSEIAKLAYDTKVEADIKNDVEDKVVDIDSTKSKDGVNE